MSFLKCIKSVVMLKPWPLSEEWERLSNEHLKVDKKAPVNLTHINFSPNRHEASRLVDAEKINFLIEEISDCLIYFTSQEAIDKGAYLYVDSNANETRKDFDIAIKLVIKEEKGRKPRTQINFSHEEVNEALELAITRSLKKVLSKFARIKKLGMELNFSVIPAHKKWQVPKKFKSLNF